MPWAAMASATAVEIGSVRLLSKNCTRTSLCESCPTFESDRTGTREAGGICGLLRAFPFLVVERAVPHLVHFIDTSSTRKVVNKDELLVVRNWTLTRRPAKLARL